MIDYMEQRYLLPQSTNCSMVQQQRFYHSYIYKTKYIEVKGKSKNMEGNKNKKD